jgi:hypothetical protein
MSGPGHGAAKADRVIHRCIFKRWHPIFLLLVLQQPRLCRKIVAVEHSHVVQITSDSEKKTARGQSRLEYDVK